MRIGIDAMGGDSAPATPVKGALAAAELINDNDEIVLIGQEPAILAELKDRPDWQERISIVHAESVIGMDESPVTALRSKRDSSIAMMAELHRNGDIDAMISAGNTGACVAAAQMRLRRLKGVNRPGIAIVAPTMHGPVAVCDVGANVSAKPVHLYQYGLMASIYLHAVCGIDNPRIGLLSVGEEEAKGNDLVKKARELCVRNPSVNFVGNVEGRDLFTGVCDVMSCEGFVGNVVLKLMEGMASGVLKGMFAELAQAMPDRLEAIRQVAERVGSKFDYNEYGGAPLLGVAGICIICHGASDYRGIKNAVRAAEEFRRHGVNEQITSRLAEAK